MVCLFRHSLASVMHSRSSAAIGHSSISESSDDRFEPVERSDAASSPCCDFCRGCPAPPCSVSRCTAAMSDSSRSPTVRLPCSLSLHPSASAHSRLWVFSAARAMRRSQIRHTIASRIAAAPAAPCVEDAPCAAEAATAYGVSNEEHSEDSLSDSSPAKSPSLECLTGDASCASMLDSTVDSTVESAVESAMDSAAESSNSAPSRNSCSRKRRGGAEAGRCEMDRFFRTSSLARCLSASLGSLRNTVFFPASRELFIRVALCGQA